MDLELDRNPSPPPELLNNEDLLPDRIGDSVYSKKWLFETLMKMYTLCSNTGNCPTTNITDEDVSSEDNEKMDEEKSENIIKVIELDPEIEENACVLWDMTTNQGIAEFLCESGAVEIFLDIIQTTESPRLVEILIGIISNIVAVQDLCKRLSENQRLLTTIITLSGTSDTPTLLQILRVILCGTLNSDSCKLWHEAFGEHTVIMENLKFILENNLNGNVVDNAFSVLHAMLSTASNVENCTLVDLWSNESYFEAILTAAVQLKNTNMCLDNVFKVLNALAEEKAEMNIFVKNMDKLASLFEVYLLSISNEETLPSSNRLEALCSFFNLYEIFIHGNLKVMQDNVTFLKPIEEIASRLFNLISDLHLQSRKKAEEAEEKQRLLKKQLVEDYQMYAKRQLEEDDSSELEGWIFLAQSILDIFFKYLAHTDIVENQKHLKEILNRGRSLISEVSLGKSRSSVSAFRFKINRGQSQTSHYRNYHTV